MEKHRFHYFFALKQFQKRWLLLLLPPINALVQFDWQGVITSLVAEAAVILVMSLVSVGVWWSAWWRLDGETLTVSTGIWLKKEITLRPEDLSCVEVYRKPLHRLAGAVCLNLYYARKKGSVPLYLPWRDGMALADLLLPAPGPEAYHYQPRGLDRVGLAAVSCNLFAALGVGLLVRSQTMELIDGLAFLDRQSLEQAAMTQFELIWQYVRVWLPAGMAWMVSVVTVLWIWALGVSAFRTARFRVAGDGQVISTTSGIYTLVDRRIRLAWVSAAELRRTPMARLVGVTPVYLRAGAFKGTDVPCCLYRNGRESQLESLLPGIPLWAKADPVALKGRSIPAFIAPAGVGAGVCLVLWLVSQWALPQLSWLLGLGLGGCLLLMLFGMEGFFREGITFLEEGKLLVRYVTGVTLHWTVVVTNQAGYFLLQNPYNLPFGRCTVKIRLPAGGRLRVRSIPRQEIAQGWKIKRDRQGPERKETNVQDCDL